MYFPDRPYTDPRTTSSLHCVRDAPYPLPLFQANTPTPPPPSLCPPPSPPLPPRAQSSPRRPTLLVSSPSPPAPPTPSSANFPAAPATTATLTSPPATLPSRSALTATRSRAATSRARRAGKTTASSVRSRGTRESRSTNFVSCATRRCATKSGTFWALAGPSFCETVGLAKRAYVNRSASPRVASSPPSTPLTNPHPAPPGGTCDIERPATPISDVVDMEM